MLVVSQGNPRKQGKRRLQLVYQLDILGKTWKTEKTYAADALSPKSVGGKIGKSEKTRIKRA